MDIFLRSNIRFALNRWLIFCHVRDPAAGAFFHGGDLAPARERLLRSFRFLCSARLLRHLGLPDDRRAARRLSLRFQTVLGEPPVAGAAALLLRLPDHAPGPDPRAGPGRRLPLLVDVGFAALRRRAEPAGASAAIS